MSVSGQTASAFEMQPDKQATKQAAVTAAGNFFQE
jgi:hypothetical protein